jgi:hypothetical protein
MCPQAQQHVVLPNEMFPFGVGRKTGIGRLHEPLLNNTAISHESTTTASPRRAACSQEKKTPSK